ATAFAACFSTSPQRPVVIQVSNTSADALPLRRGNSSLLNLFTALFTFGAPSTSWYSPTARTAVVRSSTRKKAPLASAKASQGQAPASGAADRRSATSSTGLV